jgi:hypothetical protein
MITFTVAVCSGATSDAVSCAQLPWLIEAPQVTAIMKPMVKRRAAAPKLLLPTHVSAACLMK